MSSSSGPTHPYTRALLDSIPHMSHARALSGIPGRTPAPGARPSGCRFNDRCSYAQDKCRAGVPELVDVTPTHQVRCVRHDEIGSWDISRGVVPDTDPDKPRDIILDLRHLDVYYGRKKVVHDVSIDVGKAEVVALVGESGSGKTTISRCVGGLHKEWTGDIEFEGKGIGQERAAALGGRPQADPVHLPEPLPLPEPAADDRGHRQAADGAVRDRVGQGGHRARRRPARAGGARTGGAEVPGEPALRR